MCIMLSCQFVSGIFVGDRLPFASIPYSVDQSRRNNDLSLSDHTRHTASRMIAPDILL